MSAVCVFLIFRFNITKMKIKYQREREISLLIFIAIKYL